MVFEHHPGINQVPIDEMTRSDNSESHYPEVPKEWSDICVYCGIGEVKLEGYSNIHNAVYRCWNCKESMIYQHDMTKLHWRYQVNPIMETESFEKEVKYPMRGVER